jgi:Ca-activated chloride channel homolog
MEFLRDFHFMRPAWLLALPLLWALTVWLARRPTSDVHWAGLIDAQLLPALQLDGTERSPSRGPWLALAAAWTLAVLALAGPTWEHEETAAYRAPDAWVIVLDQSRSMTAADVSPSRATRARYAVDDLLTAAGDAKVGLIAFSDEPYTVAPLTDDVGTVRALLGGLSPDIMPSDGHQLAPALDEAARLLERSATRGGQVLVLSDGFNDPAAALVAAAKLRARGSTVNMIGIGTPQGAPYRGATGRFLQDGHGAMLTAPLDTGLLQRVASTGGGSYADLAGLPALSRQLRSNDMRRATTADNLRADRWRDAGVWLLPLLLLLAAPLARKGWL